MGPTDISELIARDLMSKKPVTAEPDEHLSEVIGRMKEKDVHEVLIVDDGELLGIVSYDSLIRRRGLPPTTRASHMMDHVAHVEEDWTLLQIAETTLTTGLRALPVKKGRDLVGVISRSDLITSILDFPELAETSVESVMSPSVTCVYENDSVSRARHVMQELDARSIPVTDEYGLLVGVVGQKDIGPLVVQSQRRGEDAGLDSGPLDVDVKSIMQSPPITVTKEDTVSDVVKLMKKHVVSNIIVSEKKAPLGIVTQIDLVELLVVHGKGEEVYVQITGLEEGPEVYDEMYEAIGKTMKRIAKMATPRVLNFHIVKHHSRGDRFKHSIRGRLTTEHEMYYAKGYDWDLFVTLDEVLDQLERDVKREKEIRLDARKRKIRS
ncbi:MAG: CBS domain-containing protein [Thermoplasmata archaeon]|nr:CBS domain-containing protein [Thermoplasmata archaeon]